MSAVYDSGERGLRNRFWIWAVAMIAMLVVMGVAVVPNLQVETDVLALLPSNQDDATSEVLDRLSVTLAKRHLFLFGAKDIADARRAAHIFANRLSATNQFTIASVEGNNLQSIVDSYRPHFAYLLSEGDRAKLQGAANNFYDEAVRAAYTPSGMLRLLPLADDPLGVGSRFLKSQLPSLGNAQLDDGMLVVHADIDYVLIAADAQESVFAERAQEQLVPALESAKAAAVASTSNEIVLLSSGALLHAVAARQKAQQELQLFGGVELVAVLALMVFAFGRIRPLVLGAMVLGLSAAAAMTASHFIFGRVHVLALVFGASLIGVVIDYSMHFFADQFRSDNWTPASAVRHVGPAILLGMVTTMVGYGGLVLMPFPGLRQIAVFCIVGIAVGCGSVLCLYPILLGARRKPLPLRAVHLATAFSDYLLRWQWTRRKITVLIALAVVGVVGAAQLRVQDDIRALQASPPELMAHEQRVQALLGGGVETRFFLVQGDSEQALLQTEERLRTRLDTVIAEGKLGSYVALTRALPSEKRQHDDHELIAQRLYQNDGPFVRLMKQLGFSDPQIATRRDEFMRGTPLSVGAWLASSAANAYRHLWLGRVGDRFASVVTLAGIRDVAALTQAGRAVPGARFVDRPLEVSNVMSRYRQVTTGLLIFANLVALIVLSRRFGWLGSVRLVLPTVAACVLTVGVFGWLDIGFNLFNAFALLLVMALGIDYGIFLMHGREARSTAILSVTLSACTTLIGFGMLAFSATPFISSIGATLLLGIVCSWLFTMLSCMTGNAESRERLN
jgi:predicted exporter